MDSLAYFVMMSLRGCNMKIILALVAIWLLCGIVAAGLIMETRPATMADVELGPITLAQVLFG